MSKGYWLHPSEGMGAVLKAIIILSKSTMREPRLVHDTKLMAFFFPKADLPHTRPGWRGLHKKMIAAGIPWTSVYPVSPKYRAKYYKFFGVEDPVKRRHRITYYLRQLKKKRLIYFYKHPLIVGRTTYYFRAVSYTPSFRGLRYAKKHRLF